MAVTASVAGLAAALLPTPAASVAPDVCRPGAELTVEQADGLDVDDCDPAGAAVHHGRTSVDLPEPGRFVAAAALTVDGEEVQLHVATDPAGRVEVTTEDGPVGEGAQDGAGADGASSDEVAGAPVAGLVTTTVDRCADDRNELFGHRWYALGFPYYVNIYENLPANIAPLTFRDAVVASAGAMANGTNSCGLAVDPTLDLTMVGGTTRNSRVNGTEGRCASTLDGFNVVDFGTLTGAYGISCTYGTWQEGLDAAQETDIRINNAQPWTLTSIGCDRSKYDLRGTLTHELGHSVGLAHVGVDSTQRSTLTMSTGHGPCTFERRHLGKGDVTGLLHLYP